ncbi:hypothetical protein BDV96DRAFT_485721 [Lophiotrema nucula]|uniref:Uncharacterized protein n=1 Tax=Lophiotrema nucula TaxID=690887 RepID=A0A6A5ZM67_9PLEO|nr:hypothetical protein BDV96DRAFT_485721 [Lophiotrema nucula]
MDFSNSAFRSPAHSSCLSHDTMDHAKLVMACRFGWAAGPGLDNHAAPVPLASHPEPARAPKTSHAPNPTTLRFVPCRGRLYHQLTCSHRIRTDIVEDCGSNCLEPFNNASRVPFYCHECVHQQAGQIWLERENQHNAMYPSIDQMSKAQYDRWYDEHRQLEAQFTKDRAIYEHELIASSRHSNACSASEASQEEVSFAAELDALTIAMESPNTSAIYARSHPARINRFNLPCDPSEQLHWDLNSLTLDRGSCGLEYSAHQPSSRVSKTTTLLDEDTWHKPRA